MYWIFIFTALCNRQNCAIKAFTRVYWFLCEKLCQHCNNSREQVSTYTAIYQNRRKCSSPRKIEKLCYGCLWRCKPSREFHSFSSVPVKLFLVSLEVRNIVSSSSTCRNQFPKLYCNGFLCNAFFIYTDLGRPIRVFAWATWEADEYNGDSNNQLQ
jgi:hypothetical protein